MTIKEKENVFNSFITVHFRCFKWRFCWRCFGLKFVTNLAYNAYTGICCHVTFYCWCLTHIIIIIIKQMPIIFSLSLMATEECCIRTVQIGCFVSVSNSRTLSNQLPIDQLWSVNISQVIAALNLLICMHEHAFVLLTCIPAFTTFFAWVRDKVIYNIGSVTVT